MISALAAGAVVTALAACTGSTTGSNTGSNTGSIEKPGASGSAASAGNGAGGTAASATPSPAGPAVTITPASGAAAADPSQGITVTAAGGTLRNVAVGVQGDQVTGSYSAGRTSWHSTWALDVSRSYTVTATAVSGAGVTTAKTATFRTLTPATTFHTEIFEGYKQTYGVGMPIILTFSAPVQDKTAVERSIEIQTSKPVTGAWYWDGNQTLDFRPRDYWPADTSVALTGHFDGVQAAPGVYGYHTLTQTFDIGDSVIAVASTKTHKTQRSTSTATSSTTGRSARSKPGDDTPDGSYLTIEEGEPGPAWWARAMTCSCRGRYGSPSAATTITTPTGPIGEQGFENVEPRLREPPPPTPRRTTTLSCSATRSPSAAARGPASGTTAG